MTTTTSVLNYATASAIGDLIEITQTGAKVSWIQADDHQIFGVARHLVTDPDSAGFLSAKDDIRDAWLRITERNGSDTYLSVDYVIEKLQDRTFARYDWR